MRTLAKFAVAPMIVLAVACGRSEHGQTSARLPAELQRDLDAATSASVPLANAERGYQPMRFVSAIEQPASSAPVRRSVVTRRTPHRTASPRADVADARSPSPEPEASAVVAEESSAPISDAPAPAASAPTPSASPEPGVVVRPTPVPTTYPGGSGAGDRGGGVGEAIGTIIGVVIRGGTGGIDHCDPRRDGGRGRYPGVVIGGGRIGGVVIDMPMGVPTFPSGRLPHGVH